MFVALLKVTDSPELMPKSAKVFRKPEAYLIKCDTVNHLLRQRTFPIQMYEQCLNKEDFLYAIRDTISRKSPEADCIGNEFLPNMGIKATINILKIFIGAGSRLEKRNHYSDS